MDRLDVEEEVKVREEAKRTLLQEVTVLQEVVVEQSGWVGFEGGSATNSEDGSSARCRAPRPRSASDRTPRSRAAARIRGCLGTHAEESVY